MEEKKSATRKETEIKEKNLGFQKLESHESIDENFTFGEVGIHEKTDKKSGFQMTEVYENTDENFNFQEVEVHKNTDSDFQKMATHVSMVTVIGNIILSLFKLLAGIVAHSGAMVSDAIHSASDVFSTIIVIVGIKISSKESDKEHPYGHERMECVAAIVLSTVLLITGLGIGMDSLKTIVRGEYNTIAVPGMLALVAAIVSIAVKEAMFWYTKSYAKKLDSTALMADAWHHRSDALSSIGALIGIAGARLGFPVMDAAASFVIFFFIVKAAYDIFIDAIDKMVDHSCDEKTEEKLIECVMAHEGIQGIDLLQTRVFGNKIYVDLEIKVDGNRKLKEAHGVAEKVHDSIEKQFPKVKHIMIHVNPGK